jgi:hypothetical protein
MSTDPARLPEGVSALLDLTLAEGGEPGVLADWLDENAVHNYWEGFAGALRLSGVPWPTTDLRFGEFRYQLVCPGVMLWMADGAVYEWSRPRQASVLVLGAYRGPPDAPGMWRRFVKPDDLPKAVRRRLEDAFDTGN